MKIEIKYYDRGNTCKVDTAKNTVLIGVNGSGKTRFLKTVYSISKLKDNMKDVAKLAEHIKFLNIESVKVDGTNYNNIVEMLSDSLNSSGQSKFDNSIEDISYRIQRVCKYIADEYVQQISKNSVLGKSQLELSLSLNKLTEDIHELQSKTDEIDNIVEIMYNDLVKIAINLQIMKLQGNIFLNHYEARIDGGQTSFENYMKRLDKLKEELEYLKYAKFESEIDGDQGKRDDISKFFAEISNTNILYIDAARENIQNPVHTVERQIEEINVEVNNSFWNQCKVTDNDAIESYKKLKERTQVFNRIMCKYCNITLSVNPEITFKKNDEVIEYANLSSGEKQLISMFVMIIFNDDFNLLIIDEPEISFSLNYQGKFISDIREIINSKSNYADINVIVSTHAPFIREEFINEFCGEEVVL